MNPYNIEVFNLANKSLDYVRGWNAAISAVRASIRDYPVAGMDREIREMIDKLVEKGKMK